MCDVFEGACPGRFGVASSHGTKDDGSQALVLSVLVQADFMLLLQEELWLLLDVVVERFHGRIRSLRTRLLTRSASGAIGA